MPITMKTSDSPPERYYTTAPADYDWGWTTVLIENAGLDDRGRKIRLVEIADGYHADFQTGRYGSGGHVSMTEEQFRRCVENKFITETPEAEHVITLTREFDLSAVVEDPFRWKKVSAFLHFKKEPVDGITLSFKAINGGLGYKFVAHGPRVAVTALFNTVTAQVEAAIKGE